MADNASRRGAADLGMPLMIVAFAAMAGFLYWLNGQAAAERALEIVEDTAPEVEVSTTPVVAGEDIQMDASPFEGQFVRLEGRPVASQLGTQGVWLELPNGNPFLVAFSDGLMAEGIVAVNGDITNVEGTIVGINDSVLTAWSGAGTISDGDRLAAEFATHYMNATVFQSSTPPPDGGE